MSEPDVTRLPKWAQALLARKDQQIAGLQHTATLLRAQAQTQVDEDAQVWQFDLANERITTIPNTDSPVSFGRRGPHTSLGKYQVTYDPAESSLRVSSTESALLLIPGPGVNAVQIGLADFWKGRRA